MTKYSTSSAQTRLENYDFEMYTKSGNTAIRSQLKKVLHMIETQCKITPDKIDLLIDQMLKKIQVKHPEVNDTEPHWHIRWHVAKCLDDNFYNYQEFNLVGRL
jgi:hypothetical protein